MIPLERRSVRLGTPRHSTRTRYRTSGTGKKLARPAASTVESQPPATATVAVRQPHDVLQSSGDCATRSGWAICRRRLNMVVRADRRPASRPAVRGDCVGQRAGGPTSFPLATSSRYRILRRQPSDVFRLADLRPEILAEGHIHRSLGQRPRKKWKHRFFGRRPYSPYPVRLGEYGLRPKKTG